MSSFLKTLLVGCVSFALGLTAMWLMGFRNSAEDYAGTLRDAQRALAQRRLVIAARLAGRIPASDPFHEEALLVLGEVAQREQRLTEALSLYEQIRRDGSETDLKARLASGELQLNAGQLTAAAESFRYSLQRLPDNHFAIGRLAMTLDLAGCRNEAAGYLLQLVREDAFSARHLMFLTDTMAVNEPSPEVRRQQPDPHDPLVNLANGRYLLWQGKELDAETFLREAIQQSPDLTEAQIRLGEVLYLRKDDRGFIDWHRGLDSTADRHPDLWYLRGRWSERQQDLPAAVRCYWEAVRRDANLAPCHYRLGQLLPKVVPDVSPEPFVARSILLQKMTTLSGVLYLNEGHIPSIQSAAELSEKLGRYWEAWGWARAALAVDHRLPWAAELRDRAEAHLSSDLPQVAPALDPSSHMDFSYLPLPRIGDMNRLAHDEQQAIVAQAIQFTDDSQQLGVEFTYFNGPDVTTASGRMFEFTGGGIAILDFDLDFQPDMYFVQGCEWPPVSARLNHLDRLFWNRGNRFLDVTVAAGLTESRFGQGTTVGDYDQDGFPDLYVANTQQNRLWRNLGDGTFQDVTDAADLTAEKWTTSCLLVDLNGDTLPDIYDVNYAKGDEVFHRICETAGMARSCSPTVFPACEDQVFINLGDGRFSEQSDFSEMVHDDGRGLGIVAFRPGEQDTRLNLFVANDMTANFYLVNMESTNTNGPRWEDRGVLSGLAFDVNGVPQASMGIATADFDRNGLLDFMVTNFHAEANNLYAQMPDGSFVDDADPRGLREPSYRMLGFGTQALDADWDGWPDLIVANGHVDDFTHQGIPYRMRPQAFQNIRGKRFTELAAESVGRFFEKEQLGRGLARLDWNGDRREDVAISHLDTPSALLTNRTASSYHSVSLLLRGRTVDREAIGTIVRLTAGGREFVEQLTAGDGYLSSNERRLVIGLEHATEIERLDVIWSNGDHDVFQDLPADEDYLILQQRGLFNISRSEAR